MPTFDYCCQSCGAVFELFLLPRETDEEVYCASCGSVEVQRQIAAPRVMYKADGYYATDTQMSSAVETSSPPNDAHQCGQGGCHCH